MSVKAWVRRPATATGTVPNPLSSVSGVNLTNLNGTQVTSGTLDDARLDATVLLASAGAASPADFTVSGVGTHTVVLNGGQVISWTIV